MLCKDSEKQLLHFLSAYFPSTHLLQQKGIAELLFCSSANLGLLPEELLVVAEGVRLLEILHIDVAADNAEPAFLLLAFFLSLLDDALADLHEFFGENATLNLELKVLLALLLLGVFLVVVETLVDVLEAVVVELVELEQRLVVARNRLILLCCHFLHEVDLLADSPHQLFLQVH